mgnify:CR=1 FL=1
MMRKVVSMRVNAQPEPDSERKRKNKLGDLAKLMRDDHKDTDSEAAQMLVPVGTPRILGPTPTDNHERQDDNDAKPSAPGSKSFGSAAVEQEEDPLVKHDPWGP